MSGLLARTLLLLLLGLVLLAPRSPAAQAVQLRIVEPAAGAVVNAAAVSVVLAVDGAGLPSGATTWSQAGQFHIALDGVDVLQTTELRFVLMGVPAGTHRLQATLADYQATPLLSEEVAFTAQPVAPAPGASWFLAGVVALVAGIMLVALVLLWLFWVRPQRIEIPPTGSAPGEDEGQ